MFFIYEYFSGYGYFYDYFVFWVFGVLVWWVVIGDGIYNFSDGIVVGVVFVNSVMGGFSILVVVFCYELLYEMGLWFYSEVNFFYWDEYVVDFLR